MSLRTSPSNLWPAVGAAAAVAGLAGFGVAKLTSKPAPPAAASSAPEAKTASAITVPAANLQIMQITVEPTAAGDLATDIQAPGAVTSEPTGEALITAQAAGAVTRVNKRLGDPVKAGEVLALVASRDASAMAADRQTAQSKAALARSVLQREQQLYDQRVTPRQDLETAQAASAAADAEARRANAAAATSHVASDGRSLAIVSPINGRITAAGVALGAFVQPETELFRVADPRKVQIEVALSAADAARVQAGDPARVSDPGGAAIQAVVRSITPTLSADTRSATAILTLAEGSRRLTPGQAVQAQISPRRGGGGGVVVPDTAIQSVDGRDVVFVRTQTGFSVRPVTIGSRSGSQAAILSGLRPGEPIATRNAFLLKAELTKGGEDEE